MSSIRGKVRMKQVRLRGQASSRTQTFATDVFICIHRARARIRPGVRNSVQSYDPEAGGSMLNQTTSDSSNNPEA